MNKELAYNINGGEGKFDIDSYGFVVVNGSLDREIKETYTFQVMRSSFSSNSLRFNVLISFLALVLLIYQLFLVVIMFINCFRYILLNGLQKKDSVTKQMLQYSFWTPTIIPRSLKRVSLNLKLKKK